jgi:hypothetical protein
VPQHPLLARLREYWVTKKGDRRFPARRDIDPLDFTYVLGHVVLFDVLRDPVRYRVRLYGTELARCGSHEPTGKMLDELPACDYRDYVIDRCNQVAETGEPMAVQHDRILDGRLRKYQALWLPLSDDGERVTMLMCAVIYDWHRD